MHDSIISIEDPRSPDVRALLARHLAFADTHSPPEDVHALDVDGLLDPTITFFGLRRDGVLLGVGAVRQLDGDHVELKSMHVAQESRGQGTGRAILEHLLTVARERGAHRVSLETGSMDAFEPARSLYKSVGFLPCEPFGDYPASPNSICLTRTFGTLTGNSPVNVPKV